MNKPRTAITPTRDENYAEWYQQVVRAADLAENSAVRGCMVIKPWGYALWENMQSVLDRMFKETRRGSHEANLLAAAAREVDVATGNTSELDNFRTSRPEQAAMVRVIWESPDIPESPMVWHSALPAQVRQRVAHFVYNFGARDEEEKGILWNINKVTAWRRSSNRQLVTIADLEMFNARQRIMNDAAMTDAVKMQKVDEVTRRGLGDRIVYVDRGETVTL